MNNPGPWKRAIILAALCGLLAVIASSDVLYSALVSVLSSTAKLIAERPLLGAGLFVLLSAISAMLAFVSSSVLVPVALYTWGKGLCAFLLWLGWTLGGMAAYGLGRYFGRPVVRALLPASLLATYEDRISRHTPFGIVLLFQLALPSEVPGYLLGLVRYRFGRYLVSLMLSEIPYAVGTVYLGSSFLDRRLVLLAGLGAAGILLTFLALRLLHSRLQGHGPEAG